MSAAAWSDLSGDGAWWQPGLTSSGPRYPLNATREQKIAIVKRVLVSQLGSWQIKRRLKEELSFSATAQGASRPSGGSDILGEIEGILGSTGLGTELKNMIYHIHRAALRADPAPPEGLTAEETYYADRVDYVEEAKLQWEKRIRRELDVMAAELGVPLQRSRARDPPRPPPESQAFRFVYDDNDFLDILANISPPSTAPVSARIPRWGMIRVELATRSLAQVRDTFSEMHPSARCLSVDDDAKPAFAEEQARRLLAACEQGFIPSIRQAAKVGVPQRLRPKVWQKLLGIERGQDTDKGYFDHLMETLKETELVTDDLIRYDVAGVSDDNNYFVFEDMLSDCMSAFSRDPWVCRNACAPSQANDKLYTEAERVSAVYPPCGIVPFQGMVLFAAPLCYVWNEPHQLYFSMRAFYAQYCCRLCTITSKEGDILQLARQFETLLQEACPELVFHLCEMGLPPLKIAFNWIFFAFAGYLEVDQVLALWDRIVAWDSLLILPVLAVAIFSYRERSLLECATPDDVKELLEDTVRLKIVPLLHLFLFSEAMENHSKARQADNKDKA